MVSETYMYVPCSYYKLQEVDLEIQYEDGNHDDDQDDQTLKNMEQEIECPRCYDSMTLSSNSDRLGYICQECDLLLVMK